MAPFLPAENVPECVLETVNRGCEAARLPESTRVCVRGPGRIGLSQSTNGPIPEYRAIWKPRVELLELLGAPTPDDQSAQTRRE
jgi:hypothetical protein